jgi:hypothetical protein
MARDFSAYERAMNRMKARDDRRESSGGDFVWLKTNKPARKGEQSRQNVRIVPRPNQNGGEYDEFWVAIDQHMIRVDGKARAFVCPDNHDDLNGPKVCPLCQLSRELYSTRDPEHLQVAKEASARQRIFANVIDLEDENHPETPKIWGFSRALHHAILDICMAKRAFIEDVETGRDLILTTRRIGPKNVDIRYSVTDMDSAPLGDEWREIASKANDLEGLAKPASLDDLAEAAATLDPRKGNKRGTYTPTPNGGDWSTPAPVANVPPPSAPVAVHWSYLPPEGAQRDGLTTQTVAEEIKANPTQAHFVWRDGMAEWADTTALDEFAEAHAAAEAPATPAPPARPNGPPAPPNPRAGNAF